jgi:hypothetical protein
MYAILCTRLDICYAVRMVSRYQLHLGPEHRTAAKHILKYFQRTQGYMLVYSALELVPRGYTDFDFKIDRDFCKSTSSSVFTLDVGEVSDNFVLLTLPWKLSM